MSDQTARMRRLICVFAFSTVLHGTFSYAANQNLMALRPSAKMLISDNLF